MLASSDSWEVTFKGTGGHGAMPDRGTDPTYVAAQFIVAVQGIVGRNVPSSQAAVLSVGHIHGGTPGSPTPPGAWALRRMWTSIFGMCDNFTMG